MNLTDEQFRRWMASLRSGSYAQCRNQLVDFSHSTDPNYAFCCMGVLGYEVLDIPVGNMVSKVYLRALLPPRERPLSEEEEILFGQLNDVCKLTFPQIAAFIEGGGFDLCTDQFDLSDGAC